MVQLIGICFRSGIMQCSAFCFNQGAFHLQAHAEYTLSSGVSSELTIFSYTEIEATLTLFLATYSLKNPLYLFALEGSGIKESLQESSQVGTQEYDGYYWQRQSLIPPLHYLTGIKHELLLQYQLLAYQSKLQLLGLTTPFMAHLYVHSLYLSHIPLPRNASLEELKHFLQDTTNHYLSLLPFATTNIQPPYLIEALGLYHIAKTIYETN
jgi:hypothetical protein